MAAAAGGDHLDPALRSMVSSPASNSTAATASEGLALHGISPQPQYGAAGLPILENLMPMGHLEQFLADPGFAERAARLSGFDARAGVSGYGGAVPGQFGLPDAGLKDLELGNGGDESSVSDPASASAEMALKGPSDGNARSGRPAGRGKARTAPKR